MDTPSAASTGEALPRDIGERWTAHFGCKIIGGIGSTETLHIFLSNRTGDLQLRDQSGSVITGHNRIGDLYIQGPSVALLHRNNRAHSRDTYLGHGTKTKACAPLKPPETPLVHLATQASGKPLPCRLALVFEHNETPAPSKTTTGRHMTRWWGWVLGCALAAAAHAGDEGVTPTEIRLGASQVLTGPLGPQTVQYGAGARLLFDAVNAAGGIHGRKISFTTLDDGFDPKRALENSRKLVNEDKVFMLFNSTGTAQTAAVLPLLKESKTILFGPVTGASALRDNFNPYVFHVRAGYANESTRILSQLKQIGVTRVAFFYLEDGLGKALLAEVKKAATAEGLPLAAEIKVDPAAPGFAAAATATAQANPQAVIVGTAGLTFPKYVKAVQATNARPVFYGFSVASLEGINRELKDKARGIVLAQIMPSLRNGAVPVVAEYLKLHAAKSPEAQPSATQFEGFVHARLLVEGLRRTGRDLNTANFIRAMESAGEIEFGRFRARYSSRSHNGSNYVELAIIEGEGRLRY